MLLVPLVAKGSRLLFWGLPAVLVLLGLGALALLSRPSPINPENEAKIRPGMTLADVEGLLGGPARNESNLPDNFIDDAFVVVDPDPVKAPRPRPGAARLEDRRWARPGYLVVVLFDASGQVVRHRAFTFDVDQSWLDMLRRWLGR